MESNNRSVAGSFMRKGLETSGAIKVLLCTQNVPAMYVGYYCLFGRHVLSLLRRLSPSSGLPAAIAELVGKWSAKGLDRRMMNLILTAVFCLPPLAGEAA